MELAFNNFIDTVLINDFMSTWVPVFATLMMLSFLYRDNPLYKLGENIFLGLAIGYTWVQLIESAVIPFVIEPVGDMFTDFHVSDFTTIFWILISATLLLRFTKKWGWGANYFFGFYLGYTAGLQIPVHVQNIMVQTTNLMRPLNQGSFFETSKWIVIIFGVFAALMYFFFSSPHKGLLGKTAKGGIVILMIFFGAAFGSTVMGRVSLFIDRTLLLVNNPLQAWVSTGIIIAFLIVYFKFFHKEKEFDDEEVF